MTDNLRPTLGRRDLTLMLVGNVIGSGIFLVPASVLRQSGESVPVSVLVWCVGGLLSLMGALSYAELGGMNPRAGGLYAYIREAFGAFPAFLYGWTLFFVIGSGTVATLAVAAAGQLTHFAALTGPQRQVIAVALIVVMAAINVRGTRESAAVQNVTTWLKVLAILVMSGLLLLLGDGGGSAAATAPVAGAPVAGVPAGPAVTVSGVGLAVIAVLWAYEGWQYVTFLAGDAKDPQRTIPFALVAGTVTLIALYLLSVAGYHAALGTARMAASERVAGDAVTAVLGAGAGSAVTLAIVLAMYSAAHAGVTALPRVYFAMARDGVFFRRLSEIHPRFGTPAVAIVSSCAWAAVLAATGTFEQLLTYVVFIGWIFYGLGAAAVIALRRSRPAAERPFRVPGYPVTPALFVLAAAVIVGNTILEQPSRSLLGLCVVLLGLPAYAAWTRAARRAAPGGT
ncbi:MAG: APC family permease [Gemmatimonadota bacterium]|jgi:APA family basic amino acid/polyamine antiporter|nr:amino acid permease [Gemmatimonadota bacterium]